MENLGNHSELAIYQLEDGALQVQLESDAQTVWLSQKQLAVLFDTTPENILMHIKNIGKDGELSLEATTKDFLVVQQEGTRQVKRTVKHYNLDMVLSVGYRTNSKRAVRFRQWASQRLREYLIQGYTLNQEHLARNAQQLQVALELVRKTAQAPHLTGDIGRGLVDVVTRYTQTFLLLQRYDQGLPTQIQEQTGGVLPTVEEARGELARLKADLLLRNEATELFALERDEGLAALLGNLVQSVFGEPAYPSVEAKAAHLLYFVVKNHPFADGNKRSGAFLFVDFLNRNQRLLNGRGEVVINDMGLAALTLLIAESKPDQKEVMIKLVMTMLSEVV